MQCIERKTHRHNLPPLPQHPPHRININNSTIKTAPGTLHKPRNHKNTRLLRHPLQKLARAVPAMRPPRRNLQPALHPVVARARRRVAQINGGLEIRQELVAAARVPAADGGAERAGPWVSAQISFGKEDEVHAAPGSDGGCAFEGGEGCGEGSVRAGLGDCHCEGGHFLFFSLLFDRSWLWVTG